jgi:hypothetical protein
MPSLARSSFGTLLKIGDGASPTEAFTTIAEVRDISGPSIAVGTEEVTSHDSAGWREYIPTLLEGGEVTFDLNFNAAATQGFTGGLYDDMIDKTLRNFQILLPTTTAKTGAFKAYVTGFELSAPVEGVLTASVTLMISGSITWS